MTVSELIRALANYGPGYEVGLEYADHTYGNETRRIMEIYRDPEAEMVILSCNVTSELESQP